MENKIDVKSIFAPEHGFRGDADAGAKVKNGVDIKTGIPIVSLYGNNKKPKQGLPFMGLVAAGSPIQAIPQEETLVLENMFPGDNIFVLQVRGYSMIEDHIQDGDFIVVKKQETAINGERVVAMIDHEVTLKRFFLDRGQIRLEPCNSTMNPIIILPGNDARILGILIGVLRKC